ncbi:MAG: SCP2 domain-containing protein [Parahaliea sp.]
MPFKPVEQLPRLTATAISTMPPLIQAHFIQTIVSRALHGPLAEGHLDFLQGKWLLIKVSDAGLAAYFSVRDNKLLCRTHQQADVRLEGDALTMAQMACKMVDPDTLFFRRKLSIRGDTELGLAVKNLIDDIEIESLPIWARLPLQEYTRFSQPNEQSQFAP